MKKALIIILLVFALIINVNAEEKYNFSRIDFETISGEYDATIIDDKFYLMGEQYTCTINGAQYNSCNLYVINDKNEIVKANNRFYFTGLDDPSLFYYLETKKNEDGSYDLYTCDNEDVCKIISDIDVSALYSSYEENVDLMDDVLVIMPYYVVKDKDNKLALFDGKGTKHIDFGDYEILGDAEFLEDGISAELEKIVLKGSNGSYIFIGEDYKVVTLKKEIAEKIGLEDEVVLTIEHQLKKYYSFQKNSKTKYFTLNDGLINDQEFGESYITFYNNTLIIEETTSYRNLYKLDGKTLLSKDTYNDIYYFNDRPEMILAKTNNTVLGIHNGKEIVYTKEMENKFKIYAALIDEEGTIWIDARENEEFPVVYIIRKEKIAPETPKYSCKEVDGKYYGKDGSVVDKKTYEGVCGLKENPKTGIILPIVSLGILTCIGILTRKMQLKKNNLYKI